jgi:hypothetical protein
MQPADLSHAQNCLELKLWWDVAPWHMRITSMLACVVKILDAWSRSLGEVVGANLTGVCAGICLGEVTLQKGKKPSFAAALAGSLGSVVALLGAALVLALTPLWLVAMLVLTVYDLSTGMQHLAEIGSLLILLPALIFTPWVFAARIISIPIAHCCNLQAKN